MRANFWKLLGGAGLVAVLVAFGVVGRTTVVAGDPIQDQQAPTFPIGEPLPHEYGLGANPILYEAQPAEEQDNIDRVYQTLESSQPASSHEAFSRAADQAVIEAQAQIAERHVGLEGVEEQGITP